MAPENNSATNTMITPLPGESAKTAAKRNVPRTDMDLGSVCTNVNAKWAGNNWLVLKWLTQEVFGEDTARYNRLLSQKTAEGGGRMKLTGTLRELDKQAENSVVYIKNYLTDKYGKQAAPGYYASFGIVRKGGKYVLPKDRNVRQEALEQMLLGITREGFESHTYGRDFWSSLKQRFDTALETATQTDSGVSEKTGNKNAVNKKLVKALNSIIYSIKANYPDTWKTELRNWGFQKEKY